MEENKKIVTNKEKKPRKTSVYMLLNIILVAGILLFSGVILYTVYSNLQNGLVKYFEEEVADDAVSIIGYIDDMLDEDVELAKYVSDSVSSYFDKNGIDPSYYDVVLKTCVENFGATNVVVTDVYGDQLSSTKYGTVKHTDGIAKATTRTAYKKLIKDGSDIAGVVSYPIYHNSKVVSVVTLRKPITNQAFVDHFSDYMNIVMTVFHLDTRVYTSIEGMQGTKLQDTSLLWQAEQGNPTSLLTEINGEPYIAYYFPVNDSDGRYLTTIFVAKPFSVTTNILLSIFTVLAFVIVIFTVGMIILFVAAISSLIKRPVKRVTDAIYNLSSGEADLTMRLPIKGNNEFTTLSVGVNKFIELLHDIIKDLAKSNDELRAASLELGTNAQQAASATAEILANIESVRKQSQNQSGAVDNTSSVLNYQSKNVGSLATVIEKQNAGISESSVAIEEMLGNISSVTNSVRKMSSNFKDLNLTVQDGRDKLNNVDKQINQIAEQSNMLIQANQMISQIASQTNLLAMNAAIEAAHAGDAGKGFSVVADEIRKLSETSSNQTKRIREELKKIKESIANVVEASEESRIAFNSVTDKITETDQVIQQIRAAMEEQNTGSRQISQALHVMNDSTSEVRVASAEMAAGNKAILDEIQHLQNATMAIKDSVQEMELGAQQINENGASLSEVTNAVNDSIVQISEQIGQFKV